MCPRCHRALEAPHLQARGLPPNRASTGAAWQLREAVKVSPTMEAQRGLSSTPPTATELDSSSWVLQFVMKYSAGLLGCWDLTVRDPTSAIRSSVLIWNITESLLGLDTYLPVVQIDYPGTRRHPSSRAGSASRHSSSFTESFSTIAPTEPSPPAESS